MNELERIAKLERRLEAVESLNVYLANQYIGLIESIEQSAKGPSPVHLFFDAKAVIANIQALRDKLAES